MYASTRKRERGEGARKAGVEPRINPPFSSAFSLRGRLGVSFDHICILVMKFAPGPVISVYLTDSHSLRTGALIGHFKSGRQRRCYHCILLTDNIFDISVFILNCREIPRFSVKYILFSVVSYFSLTAMLE